MAFFTSPSLSAVVQKPSWELECWLLGLGCSVMDCHHRLEKMIVLCHGPRLLGREMPLRLQVSAFCFLLLPSESIFSSSDMHSHSSPHS